VGGALAFRPPRRRRRGPARPRPARQAGRDLLAGGEHEAGARPPWHALPERFGKPGTASRQFRRRAKQGLWTKLLQALAGDERPGAAVLRRLESWICRAYRRA
jgi:hypothetical protein